MNRTIPTAPANQHSGIKTVLRSVYDRIRQIFSRPFCPSVHKNMRDYSLFLIKINKYIYKISKNWPKRPNKQ